MNSVLIPTASNEKIDVFNRDGFYVARGLVSDLEVSGIRDTFMQQAAAGPVEGLSETDHNGAAYSIDDPLRYYPRMMQPHRYPELSVGKTAEWFMMNHRIHGILLELLVEEPLAVQSMFYFKPPGARGQDLHQDNFYLKVKPGTCMAAWLAVDDADEDNGGMVVVPGTHRLEIACPEKSDPRTSFTTEHVNPPPGTAAVTVPLKAGDVLFFNGSLIHGSYPNTSADRFRRALICHYVPESSIELAHWYENPRRFDGTVKPIPLASGGDPAGPFRRRAIDDAKSAGSNQLRQLASSNFLMRVT